MSESEKPHPPTLKVATEEARDLTGMVLGDFQVERLLGRGGMGEVYLARQLSLSRPVALKVLRPDLLSKPNYIGRFEAEATMVAKLNHPNIVHVYTLGSVDGYRFIAMEYVQGTNLREYLQKKGALELSQALGIMKQAAVAIGAAGEIGLVHRDIKPENLLLTRKGQVKVADFGLCRDQDSDHLHLTQPGVTMGTPIYMSPEQAQGHSLDHRSDLYSLGVTSYHMIAGAPPFRAESAIAVAMKHVKDTPVRLIVHRPDIPVELDHLVMKLMAKRPDQRYQSAAELLRDLNKIRETMQTVSMAVGEPEIAITSPSMSVVPHGSTAVTPAAPPSGVIRTAPPAIQATEVDGAPRPSFGSRHGIALATIALIAGLAWGWFTRPPDLLAKTAPTSTGMPGLWMVPEWSSLVEKQPDAEAQYHHAQLIGNHGDRVAAWLAVPGYYPEDRDYCTKAYIQLTRELLKQHDVERLRSLAPEIGGWKAGKTLGEELAVLVQAALSAVDDDLDGVPVQFENKEYGVAALTDAGLFDLALAVADEALVAARKANSTVLQRKFQATRDQIIRKNLNQDFRDPMGPTAPRRTK
ncbi:serine/threonine protein kinase [Singulisphaera sp. PoT]|uniref:serine/threonine protein kinase n=1 Tax=Singulisphaera sp. PoT TaxID=3411797 RepID=UPI003BF4F710